MQTYANLMSSGGYRPHLDSVDFIKFLRVTVIIALILAMAFSIRGNFKGLMQTLERDVMWLGIIALAITVTSSLLSMISVVKVKGLKIVSRVLIGCVAVGLFYISTRLTFIGFVSGEKSQIVNAVQENPELVEAKKELENIINRQGEYGLSHSEKISLLTREKKQRAWITELTKRLIVENRNKKSNLEAAIGEEKKIAMTLFALFQVFKIFRSGHIGSAHVAFDNINIDFFISWNNDRSRDTLSDIRSMRAFLSFKYKACFLENTFEYFPVNWRYTWHSIFLVWFQIKGIGTSTKLRSVCFKGSGRFSNLPISKPDSFIT
jgi:hypothetical protein